MITASATAVQDKAVAEMQRLNFTWTEVALYDLSELSPDRRVQVREPKNYAPRDIVEQYAVQMGQSQFPPIVVTSDGWIVDGNTRVGACHVRDNKFFPAYVLDVAFRGSSTTEKQRDEMHALAATLNAQGGVRLTPRETRAITEKFLNLGWKPEQIGRAIGLKPSSITAVRKEIDAATKLVRVGMDANGSLRGASLRALGSKEALTLNDGPYKSLATLAGDAGLNAGEIVSAAKQARTTGSDREQVELLEGLRTEMGERIKTRNLTGIARPPVSRQLRQHLGFVTKFAGRENELLETDPNVRDMHIETLQLAGAVLASVLELQRAS